MKTRIISGLCMVPFLALLIIGGIPLYLACVILSAIGMYEFYKGLREMGKEPAVVPGFTSLGLLYLVIYLRYFACVLSDTAFASSVTGWLFVTVCFGLFVCLVREDHDVFSGPLGSLGAIYIAFFCSHVVLLERLEGKYVWLIFLSAFGTDIMAYFTGYFLGKHKLCPKLSPKKTIEGAIGGVLGSVLFCTVFALIAAKEDAGIIALAGLIASPFAQAGDLIASAFKRKMGIKDYGKLIPGHGGIMDRIDSVLLTAPVMYYLFLLLK